MWSGVGEPGDGPHSTVQEAASLLPSANVPPLCDSREHHLDRSLHAVTTAALSGIRYQRKNPCKGTPMLPLDPSSDSANAVCPSLVVSGSASSVSLCFNVPLKRAFLPLSPWQKS